MVVCLAVAVALLVQGCANRQVVRFEAPDRAKAHVVRSFLSKGPSRGELPFEVRVTRGRVYRVRLTFDAAALEAVGLSAPEIERLQARKANVLEGGLVCPELGEGSDPDVVVVLELNQADVRTALDQGWVVMASTYDDAGHLRALFKASTAGIALDDPELAEHGRPVSGTLVVAGNVLIAIAASVVLLTLLLFDVVLEAETAP